MRYVALLLVLCMLGCTANKKEDAFEKKYFETVESIRGSMDKMDAMLTGLPEGKRDSMAIYMQDLMRLDYNAFKEKYEIADEEQFLIEIQRTDEILQAMTILGGLRQLDTTLRSRMERAAENFERAVKESGAQENLEEELDSINVDVIIGQDTFLLKVKKENIL